MSFTAQLEDSPYKMLRKESSTAYSDPGLVLQE